MTWIDAIFSKLAILWPLVKINAWERGVRLRFGKVVRLEGPGIHFAFWWFEEIHTESVVQQVRNLPTQSITTKDNRGVSFSANITYEVTDLVAKLTEVDDFNDSLVGLAMMHLAERVRDWTWDELREGQKELERSLRGTLTTRTKDWGVRVVGVGLTDCAQSRQFRLYGDPMFH